MTIVHRGYTIVSHWGLCDAEHYHYGLIPAGATFPVPMDCQGPRSQAEREYYGDGGCVSTVEEAEAGIHRDIALYEQAMNG